MTTILGAAASGLQHYNRAMDVIGHNLANVNSGAFKASRAVSEGAPNPAAAETGGRLGVATTTIDRLFNPGGATITSDPLHFGIQDDAFFQVTAHDGEPAFTRYGALSLDAARNIVAHGGRHLDPPIALEEGMTRPAIDRGGIITALDAEGETVELGRIPLLKVGNPRGLEAIGDGLYRQTANSGEITEGLAGEDGFAGLLPGGIEGSNVDISTEFANMVIAQRAYQANARSFSVGDEMLAIATNITR